MLSIFLSFAWIYGYLWSIAWISTSGLKSSWAIELFKTKIGSYVPETEKDSCMENNLNVVVSSVIDGDTFKYTCNNWEYTVRIIWIDTPETKHPEKGVQCFGFEATNYSQEILQNKSVTLLKGNTSNSIDKYWRLLRYVKISWDDFWEKIIQDWYAFSYKKFPHDKLDKYRKIEIDARINQVGLWNPNTCNY